MKAARGSDPRARVAVLRLHARAAALLALLFVCAGPAAAAPAAGKSGKNSAAAIESLLAEAEAAEAKRDFLGAYRILVQAYQQAPLPILLYRLGSLAAAEQRAVAARDLLRRFLLDETVEPSDPRRQKAQALLDTQPVLEAGEVVINAPRGALISLDGRLVGAMPLAAPLLIGTGGHYVGVQLARWRAESQLMVRAARRAEVRFKLGSDVAVVSVPSAVLIHDRFELPIPLAEASHQAIEGALGVESYASMALATAKSYAAAASECQSEGPRCDQYLASRYGADAILVATIKPAGPAADGAAPATYALTLSLRDTAIGGEAATASPGCTSCTQEQLASLVRKTVQELIKQARERPRGQLHLVSMPPGAEVFLGEQSLGVTPLERPLWTGAHSLSLRLAGHEPLVTPVEITREKTTELAVTLTPIPIVDPLLPLTKPPPKRRPLWRIGAGAAIAGVGLIVTSFGIAALSQNNSCLTMPDETTGACALRTDTTAVGGGLVGAGLVLTVGGVALAAWPPK